MKKFLASLLLVAMAVGLAACTQSAEPEPPKTTLRESEDYYAVYSSELTSLNYLVTSTTLEFGLATNLVDGLVEHNHLGIIQPCLAESWTVSEDGLVWTFKIKPGIKWVTYEGEEYAEVTAHDWVAAHKYGFNPANASKNANIVYEAVKNGKEYYNGEITDWEQVGIKALDDYTLEYTLNRPIPYFLTMLTYVSFLPVNGKFLEEVGEEFGTDHTKILYNGAYRITEWVPQDYRTLVKNEHYWDKDKIYIKNMYYRYNKEAGTLAPDLFLQGEISGTGLSTEVLNDWMNDPEKKEIVTPVLPSTYSYFYAFNFDPQFDAEYEPDNWKIAVNNKNFRKSLFHGLDRISAMLTAEPFNPQNKIINTVTPKNFVSYGGKDFTQYGPLKDIVDRDSFDPELAKEYRDKAKAELEGKAKFPIKAMMPYNSTSSSWAQRCIVVEQQLESLLGQDYIDIIPVAMPGTNFLANRRTGNYAFLECNWGPDYCDPETYSDPFYPPAKMNYNWPEKAIGYDDPNGLCRYQNLVEEAKAEVTDLETRFEKFAIAEAWLIEEAFIIPYGLGGGGYQATKVEPFTAPYATFGMDMYKWKGQIIMDKPMNMDEWNEAYAKWQADRAAALAAQGQ
ncbi:MAG: peptide ABC transporter substrate-binding protein [Firmicutes bacterium]|jgi:oligopeptide transport system substrate-binding protein|nr:peptide ABC transporter substrate-binding protein [Candidatus Fermentithermobacillaceae bacterium]